MDKKSIIIFSHGFGVQKDDRGLFTDIADLLPEYFSYMFDYNDIDLENNTLTVKPFSEQVQKLKQVVEEQRVLFPHAEVNLIAHSQGSRVVALAKIPNIQKTILIAPPIDSGFDRTLLRYKDNPDAKIHLNGMSELPRSDGSRTCVPAAYWKERKNERSPLFDYNDLSAITKLYIIKASDDTVLGDTPLDGLNENITVFEMSGDHDFTNNRVGLSKKIQLILSL